MEELVPVEGQGQLPSPHLGSLRRAVAAALALDGESTMGRKKKKKESRPESIIVYRSDNENMDEEPEESEGGDQPKEEEGEDFLDYPMDDGESFRDPFETIERKPKGDPPFRRQTRICSFICFLVIRFSHCCCHSTNP